MLDLNRSVSVGLEEVRLDRTCFGYIAGSVEMGLIKCWLELIGLSLIGRLILLSGWD